MTLSMTSTSLRYSPGREQPDMGASAPTLVDKLYSLLFNQTVSTAPQMKQAAIFLIDGHPLLLSSTNNTESPALIEVERLGFADQLNGIKDVLGLTVTQLAELFKVTRKTVYDWYDGADPRAGMGARIETLNHLLHNSVFQGDMKRLKQVWNLPINGESFIDIVNSSVDHYDLKAALEGKLEELTPRMVPPNRKPSGITSASRMSNFGETIRDADVSR